MGVFAGAVACAGKFRPALLKTLVHFVNSTADGQSQPCDRRTCGIHLVAKS
ncbi:ubiquinol-cytochrome-c reductase cytochrome c1, partial [Colletotrichum scovillei]